jgi:TRAP transporter TAXI family solute receptor
MRQVLSRRALGSLAAAALTAPALGRDAAAQELRDMVLIGRGATGSTSDLVMAVMEEAIKRVSPATRLRRLPGSATAVPQRIEANQAQIGHGVGESAVDAWLGQRLYAGRPPMRNLRFMGAYLGFLMRPSAGPTLVVNENSPVRSWEDLRNRRIGVGPPDSLNSRLVNVALAGIGLSYERITANGGLIATGDWNQQLEALGDGQLDGVFVLGDHPSTLVTQFAATRRTRLVTVPDAAIEALIREYPTSVRNRMDPGTYEWQTHPVEGIQLSLGFLVHKDVPEDLVYRLCRQLYVGDNARIWGETVPTWRGAEAIAPRAASITFLPLHPGARRCFEEANIPITTIAQGAAAV